MKKRYLVGIILIITIVISYMCNYLNKDGIVIMDEEKQVSTTSSISMMLETGASTGMYEVSSDTSWPTSGYTFNEKLSKCENGSTLVWDSDNSRIIVSGNVSDRCYIYFDVYIEPTYTISEILASKTISTRTDFSVAFTEDTTGIVYETTDNDGTTYYWAGDASDNYVYFAGSMWRIVRINGDGTLRLIYNSISHSGFYFNFSGNYANASYEVGYTYTAGLQRPTSQNDETDSTIKTTLDEWYTNYFAGTEYEQYIYQNGKFCNDRSASTSSSGTAGDIENWDDSNTSYYFGAYFRYNNYSPSLICDSELDIYNLNVGLITVDEVMLAGGSSSSNSSYYLYEENYNYWTMSPSYYQYFGANSNANIFYVGNNGGIYFTKVYPTIVLSIKPVINLNSDILLTGSGTIESPYEVYMD